MKFSNLTGASHADFKITSEEFGYFDAAIPCAAYSKPFVKVDSKVAIQQISQYFSSLNLSEYVWISLQKREIFEIASEKPYTCITTVSRMSELLPKVKWSGGDEDVTDIPIPLSQVIGKNCSNIGFAAFFNGSATATIFTDQFSTGSKLKILCGEADEGKISYFYRNSF